MPRTAKPSHVLELPLETTPSDERRLPGVFEAGRRLINVLLQDGLRIVDALRVDPRWVEARKMPRGTKEQRDARNDAFTALKAECGFTDYDFQARAVAHKNAAGFSDRLGSHIAQKLGTRVFRALEEYLFGKRGRPRFKGRKRPLHSLESKNNAAALRWDSEAGCVRINKDWALYAAPVRLGHDEWLWSALQGKVKYVRLVRRATSKGMRYAAQLVMDGHAPMKASLAQRLLDVPEGSTAGIDIGPSTIAWCTATDAGIFKFCAVVDAPQALIRRTQRKLDRQRRANNPDNFDEKGRAKRGRRWVWSERQVRTEARLRALQTRTAECRANAHGRDINNLLSKARSFRHDGVSVRSLQRNYGRAVGARAPGRFMSELARKAESAGGASLSVNVRQLKTSQYDHSTGSFRKKKLSERWHVFGDGRGRVQRDVYSAFLALHAVESVDADGVVGWSYDRTQLEAAWVTLEPALRDSGLFIPTREEVEGASTSETTVEGARIAPRRGSCQPSSGKAPRLASVPGARARGAARVESSPCLGSEPAARQCTSGAPQARAR